MSGWLILYAVVAEASLNLGYPIEYTNPTFAREFGKILCKNEFGFYTILPTLNQVIFKLDCLGLEFRAQLTTVKLLGTILFSYIYII